MKRCFVAIIAVAGLLVGTMPVSAETAFNEMASCVKSWGKGCEPCKSSGAAATTKKMGCTKCVDAIGNKVPTGTTGGTINLTK